MIKLIKLIYINLLSLLDYNKIIIANKNNVKSGYEYKPIIIIIISLLYGYISYTLLNHLGKGLSDKTILLNILFIINTIVSLIISIYCSISTLYNNSDNDLLFALPIEKKYIILSKLFNIYIKNILFIAIFSISSLLAYHNYDTLDETLILIVIIFTIMIPIIPIFISSIISYISNYINATNNKSIKVTIKTILTLTILLIAFIIYKNNLFNDLEILFKNISKITSYIYPLYYLYRITVINYNLLTLFIFIFISILLISILKKIAIRTL